MGESQFVADAIPRESAALETNLTILKPLAFQRLCKEIADNESSHAMRAIEIAGRFRECDWFVRNSENNLGVFVAIAENVPSDALAVAEKYRD